MAISDGLDRMNTLLTALGNPEKSFKALHVAGTNGKGSTCVMIASILEQAGYSVGLYTSPHLEIINERIQIWNGQHEMISDAKFDELASKVDNVASKTDGGLELHYFERITAIAYLYFEEINPDYVVLETGLGGRLDSTNTLEKPLVSVITQVGLDHTKELGNTIYKIVREKAGIIKPGVPVVSQDKDITTQQIVTRVATENGCDFVDVSSVRNKFRKYELGMRGIHQMDNAATAVMAIRAAGIEVSESAIKEGLKKAVIPGRFEVIKDNPCWIIDGAHNPDAIQIACDAFDFVRRNKKLKKPLVIFGCMRDKNYSRMLQLMHQNLSFCDFAFVDYGNERCLDPNVLGEMFNEMGHGCTIYDTVSEACEEVQRQDYDSVLVLGSIYLAGAVRQIIL